ncbi:MAG: anhydro-N-acetylmuramic acid kinase, partial [Alphaproteobacteria bacterium]|nr:anhydro-N-acetylmuramic acid kinase [Alphaproteobacteria bacterium]
KKGLVLPQHKIFAKNILKRINSKSVMLDFSDAVGISGQYMEARIMADMAYCYLKKIPFTKPEITGCRKSCISGVICLPGENLRKTGRGFTYSRAAKGWL